MSVTSQRAAPGPAVNGAIGTCWSWGSEYPASFHKDLAKPTMEAMLKARLVHQNVLMSTHVWSEEINEEGSIAEMIFVNDVQTNMWLLRLTCYCSD